MSVSVKFNSDGESFRDQISPLNFTLWFCLWSCLSQDSNDRQVLSWSVEHDTCMAECNWMEVISPPLHSLFLSPLLSFCCCRWLSFFCSRDDHGCHQRSQMKGGLYPHLCPSFLTPLSVSLPLFVISHPSPLNNEQTQPPVLPDDGFYNTVALLYRNRLWW